MRLCIHKRRVWRHQVFEQPSRIRIGLLEDPLTAWSTALFTGRPEHHRQADRAEHIEQPGQATVIVKLVCLPLDDTPEQKRQQTAESVHLDLLLLKKVMASGRRVPGHERNLETIRAHAHRQLQQLPSSLHAVEAADPPYPVQVSAKLRQYQICARDQVNEVRDAST